MNSPFKTKHYILKVIVFSAIFSNINAAESLSGKGEIGINSFSGNSKVTNINAAVEIEKTHDKWKHNADIQAIRNTSDGQVNAQQYSAELKSDYYYKYQTYGFFALRYDEDKFSSFEYQNSFSFGFGTRIIETDNTDLDLSMGIGVKRLKQQLTKEISSDSIVRLGADYLYQINENSQITENLLIEMGDSNTQVNSVIAFESFITELISTKFSYSIKYNSTTPVDTKSTDTQAAITLLFRFK